MKFIHTADIHLDSPLKGLERYPGAPVDQIRGAARRALENLVELAVAESVDFVLIAGDFYDGDWRDFNTGLFFIAQMSRLREAQIPVYMIAGNHDAANRMTRSLQLPDHVKMLSPQKPESLLVEEQGVAIHGQSFATQAVYENLAEAYPAAVPGLFNIGLLHTCLSSQEHERYAPCSVEELKLKGYDYWALGHVHQRQCFSEKPWIGFSGNLQGRHARETGPKGCLLVEVDGAHAVQSRFVELDTVRWERATVDLTGVRGIEEMLDFVQSKLEFVQSTTGGRLLAARVELTGATEIHRQLLAQPDRWMQEIRAAAIDVGGGEIWIEKIQLQTHPPNTTAEVDGLSDTVMSELKSLLAEIRGVSESPQLWTSVFEDVTKKLPPELQSLAPLGDADWFTARLDEAEAVLLSELVRTEDQE